jgi:hypothetical protein
MNPQPVHCQSGRGGGDERPEARGRDEAVGAEKVSPPADVALLVTSKSISAALARQIAAGDAPLAGRLLRRLG